MSRVAYAVSVALAGSYAPTVLAQDATADLEAVIVTARKREETLLDIPQEVQTISQQEMERANLSTLQDLQRFVPSLTYNANTPAAVSIFFRGVLGQFRVGSRAHRTADCRKSRVPHRRRPHRRHERQHLQSQPPNRLHGDLCRHPRGPRRGPGHALDVIRTDLGSR